MEELPSKRRGRPRKNLDLPPAIEEGSDASSLNDGNGPTGGVGIEIQAVSVGQSKDVDFLTFSVLLQQKQTLQNGIRIAYHPKPESELIYTEKGNIVVLSGDMCYQTSDGEKHLI